MTDQSVNVYIRAIDQFSGTAAKVSGSLKTMEGAAGKFGGALSHAKGQLSGLVGSLGVLGGATALLGVGSLLSSSVTKARDFGAEVVRLKALTGDSAQSMSALSSAFEHFGINSDAAKRSIGFLEKNVGLLAAQKDGIAKFEKEFGLQLTDTNGKIKGANDLLLTTSDFFNNALIPSTTKAAALSKLFGRSWQDLIPILSAGRQGIADVEAEAAKMGLTLNEQNLKDLIGLRDATREWDTALGGLQVQIGLALVPALTDLAKAATTFIANNRDGIVSGFKSAAKFAGELADALNKTVVPAIGAIAGAWNSIPKEFRDLLVGGFVAQKASHWLFGSGPLDWAKGLLGAGAKKSGIGAALGGIGVQHVWVDNPGFGGGGGGGGLPGGGGVGAAAGAGGFLAPGFGALGAAVAAPFAMFYGIPALARAAFGPGTPAEALSRKLDNGVTLNLNQSQVAQFQGLMPGFSTLAKGNGATTTTTINGGGRSVDGREGAVAARMLAAATATEADQRETNRILRQLKLDPTINVSTSTSVSITELNNRGAIRFRIGPTSGSAGSRELKFIS